MWAYRKNRMTEPTLSSVNPFSNFQISGMGAVSLILMVIIIAILVLGIIGFIAWYIAVKKQYYLKIHLFKLIGNSPTRVAVLKAKEVPFGRAGDKLWRVAPPGLLMPFKIVKWLPIGKYQTAPNEFWYWMREDGEWINFRPTDIDSVSREMKIKFVQEDMRLQRLATEKLLEQRLMNKSFWEKYGIVIGYVIFFLVITVSLIIIFYQWSKIIDQTNILISKVTELLTRAESTTSLIPAK